MTKIDIGFGGKKFTLAFYIANRPPIDHYQTLVHRQALAPGELEHIVKNCSNHWRKVFNVMAKFLFELRTDIREDFSSWQNYRDEALLQHDSHEALLFSKPDFNRPNCIHIICGKSHAQNLQLPFQPTWIDTHFAIHDSTIICPYLDYRQLSNERIGTLVDLVESVESVESVSRAQLIKEKPLN
ncbi:MAG: hypothetical protein ACI93R_001551 [Flavobacteriales bacterium]|jgi:hypothetical protein